MSTLLILTVGQADVQLVLEGVRHELRKDRLAALHEEIERHTSAWRLVESPDRKDQHPVDALPEGELHLCTPKLDAVLCYCRDRGSSPTVAVVLDTRRDSDAVPADPRLAGVLVEERLKAMGVDTVIRRTYLEGSERLEDRSEPHDAVVRRDVVHRLEQTIHETLQAVNPSRVLVAATGGFPVVSDLVEEIARLHARAPVEALEVSDGAMANPPTGDRVVPRTSIPEPLVSFQARRRALELLGKGNLLGAWAIAEPLHHDQVEHRWTQIFDWLGRFAASLPMPEDCDIAVLTPPRMAGRAALRVELALRAGDIPRAVHGTVAFFECALWDHLLECFERDPQDTRYLKLKHGKTPPTGKLLRDGGTDDVNRPFERKPRPDHAGEWFYFHESGGGRFARDYVKSKPLKSLADAVEKIKPLRNDVAHNEPTPGLMADACRRMTKARLWSERNTFLDQELIREVLTELGLSQPGQLLRNLLETVRQRVTDPT